MKLIELIKNIELWFENIFVVKTSFEKCSFSMKHYFHNGIRVSLIEFQLQ